MPDLPGIVSRVWQRRLCGIRRWRTHLSLGKDAPQGRLIQTPDEGEVIEIQEVGGLHHHYERRIA